MAARRVQGYLDQHRIGPLFEDLMAKLIKDMPDHPIPYLIKTLKKQQPEDDSKRSHSRPPSGSRSMSPGISKTIGLTGTPIARQSLDDSRDFRQSAVAKSWAAPDSYSDPYRDHTKQRDYDRPWLTGSKPIKTKGERSMADKDNIGPGVRVQQSTDQSSWDPDTRVPSHDFNDLFQQRTKTVKDRDKSSDYRGAQSWNENDTMDSSLDKRGIGYPLHIERTSQPVPAVSDDGLEGEELKIPNDISKVGDSSDSSSVSSYGSGRSHKQKARFAAEEHRRQLQALLMKKSEETKQQHESEDVMDDGTELLENANDLQSEGVSNTMSSGAKLSKSLKAGMATPETVKVSICARCARVITGLPNDQASEVGSTFSSNTGTVDDDNFESISQTGSITGDPQRVTWPSGFDGTESEATPKRGQHMWQSTSPKPEIGKHMFRGSSFPTDLRTSSRPPSASSDRSDGGLFSKPGTSQSWKHSGYSSDNETDTNFNRSSSPELGESRPWTRPPPDSASDAGSGTWVQERKKVAFKSKGSRRYGNLSEDSDS